MLGELTSYNGSVRLLALQEVPMPTFEASYASEIMPNRGLTPDAETEWPEARNFSLTRRLSSGWELWKGSGMRQWAAQQRREIQIFLRKVRLQHLLWASPQLESSLPSRKDDPSLQTSCVGGQKQKHRRQ